MQNEGPIQSLVTEGPSHGFDQPSVGPTPTVQSSGLPSGKGRGAGDHIMRM